MRMDPGPAPTLRHRGFSFISLIAVLMFVGLLYLGYINLESTAESTQHNIEMATRAGQDVSCRMNRQAIQQALLTWSVTHPGQKPTLQALRRSGAHVPDCPERGRIEIKGGKVVCSVHQDPAGR